MINPCLEVRHSLSRDRGSMEPMRLAHLARTPRIINFTIPQDDWSLLGEMAVPGD